MYNVIDFFLSFTTHVAAPSYPPKKAENGNFLYLSFFEAYTSLIKSLIMALLL